MTPKARQSMRRMERLAEREGGLLLDVVSPSVASVRAHLQEFYRVEAAGWKGEGGSAMLLDRRKNRLFDFYAEATAAEGTLRLLFLRHEGEAVAGLMLVEYRDRLWGMKIGYDENWARFSPGNLLSHAGIRLGYQRGLERYEFLGKAEEYQRRWPIERHMHSTVHFYPYSVTGGLALAGDVGGYIVTRLKRRGGARETEAEEDADRLVSPEAAAPEPPATIADPQSALGRFELFVKNESLIVTNPSLRGLSPSLLETPGGAIYYGTGLSTPRAMSIGLPFDVLGMILAAEKLRRSLDFSRIYHHVADSHALSNAFTNPAEVDALAQSVEKTVARIAAHLDLEHLRVVRASSFDKTPEYARLLQGIRTDKHEYVKRELADMLWYKREHGVALKMGWIIQATAAPGGFDERLYDQEYKRLFGEDLSFVYLKAGRTFDRRRLKASPYIAIADEQRILLAPGERVHAKIEEAMRNLAGPPSRRLAQSSQRDCQALQPVCSRTDRPDTAGRSRSADHRSNIRLGGGFFLRDIDAEALEDVCRPPVGREIVVGLQINFLLGSHPVAEDVDGDRLPRLVLQVDVVEGGS